MSGSHGLGNSNHLYNAAGSVEDFVPELWSDDIIAAYKTNLVVANLVSKINHKGKRGDTINIPVPVRGAASAKAVADQITLVTNNSSTTQVLINKHYEYSVIIEDILNVQALPSLRRFHTDDAGYALATQIDQDLHIIGATSQNGARYSTGVIGGDGSTVWDGTANSNTGNQSTLTDAGLRQMIQTLDDANVPFMNRYLIIPPVEKNSLMGLSRFTEQAFVGEMGAGNIIRNGKLGDLYGVEIFVSTGCPYVHTDTGDGDSFFDFSSATATTGQDVLQTGSITIGAGGAAVGRVGLLLHKDAFVFAEQMGIRSQAQYKQEYLGTLLTSDTIYGTAELRDDASVAFFVPD